MPGQSVLFDMDGLLLDTERVCLMAFNEVATEFGLPDIPSTYLATIGLRSKESRSVIEAGLAGRVGHDEFCDVWDQRIHESLDIKVPLIAGVVEFLTLLNSQNVRMVVGTSTGTKSALDCLGRAGILDFFDGVIGGDQVENGKPDPEVYHKAAAVLGVTTPQCFIFEDSDTGILAAVRSGGKAVQIPDLIQPSTQTVALGHVIAKDLMAGAQVIGLIV